MHGLCLKGYAEEMLDGFLQMRTAFNGDEKQAKEWMKQWSELAGTKVVGNADDLKRAVGKGF